MSLTFKDNQIAVISPGSGTTLIQCGLSESLQLPASSIATRVYSSKEKFTFTASGEAIAPLVGGRIVNEGAFHYFLRQTYRNVCEQMGVAPALMLVKSPQWSKRQLERLTQHLFERAGVPALMLVSSPVASAFALAAKECIVVDVGLEKTEVSVVSEFSVPPHLTTSVRGGGAQITEFLAREFGLSGSIAEELKLSGIVEVLAGEREGGGGGLQVESEEGVIDVAAIVSSGRTHEFIEQRERQKNGGEETEQANAELEENTFRDSSGVEHRVGRARFQACDKLSLDVARAVGVLVPRVLPRVQGQLWQNIIVTGRGALVPGLRQGILAQLEGLYLVSNTSIGGSSAQQFGAPDTSTKQTPNEGDAPGQAPTGMKLAQLADHFPEWKSSGWAQTEFLGAQIAAKQSFSSQVNYAILRQDYNELGPGVVWDL